LLLLWLQLPQVPLLWLLLPLLAGGTRSHRFLPRACTANRITWQSCLPLLIRHTPALHPRCMPHRRGRQHTLNLVCCRRLLVLLRLLLWLL
jgi:hypothetical protein